MFKSEIDRLNDLDDSFEGYSEEQKDEVKKNKLILLETVELFENGKYTDCVAKFKGYKIIHPDGQEISDMLTNNIHNVFDPCINILVQSEKN